MFNKFEKEPKYGLRKFSVGLCAAILGTAFFLNTNEIKADTTTQETEQSVVSQNKSSENKEQADEKSTVNQNNDEAVKQSQAPANEQTSNENPAPAENKENSETVDASQQENTTQENVGPVTAEKPVATTKVVPEYKDPDPNSVTKNGDQEMTVKWTDTKAHRQDVMAGQTNVDLQISVNNLPAAKQGQSFNLQVGNPTQWQIQNDPNVGEDFTVTVNHENNDFTITANKDYNGQNGAASFTLPVTLMPKAAAFNVETDATINITMTDPEHQTMFKQDVNVNVKPLVDKVNNERVKVFVIKYGTDDSNVPQEDQGKKVLQWGLYWNYGQNPLTDVYFQQTFSTGQTIIPQSIKVFEIPDRSWVVNQNGNRINLDNVYQKITTYKESTAFEDLLKSGVNDTKNKITIAQNGPFMLGNENASDKIFFIQLDTLPSEEALQNWTKGDDDPYSKLYMGDSTANLQSLDGFEYTNFLNNGQSTANLGNYTANVYFINKDQTDKELAKVIGVNSTDANTNISFAGLNQVVAKLEKDGYVLDGIATGANSTKLDLATSPIQAKALLASADPFGNFAVAPKNFTLVFSKTSPAEKPGKDDPNKDKPTTPGDHQDQPQTPDKKQPTNNNEQKPKCCFTP
ncbi:YSIRK-type signal peptide-containing protein [Lactobacillus xujianguonis]|uniref:YSIRK-type signal peptide-containing protein n=1 Tax=Lactobacillus xujianguonis TaxID=2495899 RepID=UPI000FD85157|nr:YSIRK-type signal peptide-containing protein [Lactobacillus xujianguonis]RVU73381.1 YSIRK-type signal peptide-containing protein [Lactobacillus xujianguonis]